MAVIASYILFHIYYLAQLFWKWGVFVSELEIKQWPVFYAVITIQKLNIESKTLWEDEKVDRKWWVLRRHRKLQRVSVTCLWYGILMYLNCLVLYFIYWLISNGAMVELLFTTVCTTQSVDVTCIVIWWYSYADAEKMSLSHLAQKFFMLFLVAPVSLHLIHKYCFTCGR